MCICTTILQIDSLMNIPSRNKICRDWTTEEFLECADAKLREAIIEKDFNCSVVWWEKFFPENSRSCDSAVEGDLDEVLRIGQVYIYYVVSMIL